MALPRPTPDEPAPGYRKDPIRIACVQLDSKLGDVRGNTSKILRMTAGIRPGSLDLLVLPEMCLTGYVYTTPTSIIPFLEPAPRIGSTLSSSTSSSSSSGPTTAESSASDSTSGQAARSNLTDPEEHEEIGPTTRLAQTLASRLSCTVIAGYPESGPWLSPSPSHSSSSTSSTDSPSTPPASTLPIDLWNVTLSRTVRYPPPSERVGYNSLVVVGKDGGVVGGYRKTALFYTDMWWAREGDGFRYFDLPAPLGRVCVGICMDMNPKDFVAPYDAYELANFVKDVGGDILVVPMNWLRPPEEDFTRSPLIGESEASRDREAPEESTLNYWASRLTPLHDPSPGYAGERLEEDEGGDGGSQGKGKGMKEVVFVACNRVGVEEGTTFVGTSCVMTIEAEPTSRIELVEVLGQAEEAVLFATVN